jgi:hypothetical protein
VDVRAQRRKDDETEERWMEKEKRSASVTSDQVRASGCCATLATVCPFTI